MPGSDRSPIRPRPTRPEGAASPVPDADAFRRALRDARRRTGVRLVFGGRVGGAGSLRLSEFLGTCTDSINGLRVVAGKGLGGRVLAHRRPFSVNDYVPATAISHDYDSAVLREGIRSIVAAPVAAGGEVHGVLYAAVRDVLPLGDRTTGSLVDTSRRLAGELAVRAEVNRRLRLLESATRPAAPDEPAPPAVEAVRDLHAELLGIAHEIEDTALRDRLRHACDRFLRTAADDRDRPDRDGPAEVPRLAPRELDVLAHIALGCTNAETARRLALGAETVKAYLRSATRKLGVHSRHEAVAAARRHGLLP